VPAACCWCRSFFPSRCRAAAPPPAALPDEPADPAPPGVSPPGPLLVALCCRPPLPCWGGRVGEGDGRPWSLARRSALTCRAGRSMRPGPAAGWMLRKRGTCPLVGSATLARVPGCLPQTPGTRQHAPASWRAAVPPAAPLSSPAAAAEQLNQPAFRHQGRPRHHCWKNLQPHAPAGSLGRPSHPLPPPPLLRRAPSLALHLFASPPAGSWSLSLPPLPSLRLLLLHCPSSRACVHDACPAAEPAPPPASCSTADSR
jgi:hypothetical protein